MSKFIVIHRKDANNVGDMASNPLQYFLRKDEYESVDILDLGKVPYRSDLPIIVGGGGLIENTFMADQIIKLFSSSDKNTLSYLWSNRWESSNSSNKQLSEEFTKEYHVLIKKYLDKLQTEKRNMFLWGAGHNGEIPKKEEIKYPDWLAEFNEVGIRDYGKGFTWAPCASCMHPALRKNYTIKNDVVWFEHKKQLVKDFGNESIPRFINSGTNIDQTIELLGSANTILTNSYHGVYWGTLLKKKVILVGSWSTKFLMMKHPPTILEKGENWRTAADRTTVYNTALDECISATESFWNKIRSKV